MTTEHYRAHVLIENDELTVGSEQSSTETLSATVEFDKVLSDGVQEGTFDHRQLQHRDKSDQHPTAAISGLDAQLGGKVGIIEHYNDIYSLPPAQWFIWSNNQLVNGIKQSGPSVGIPLLNPLVENVETLGWEFYLPVPQDANIPIYNSQGFHIHFSNCNKNWRYKVRVETWAFERDGITPCKIYDYTYDNFFRPEYGAYLAESINNKMLSEAEPKFAKAGQVVTYKVFVTAFDPIGATPGTPTMAIEVGNGIDTKFFRNVTGVVSANSIHAINVNGQETTQGQINIDVQKQLNDTTANNYASETAKNADANWRNYRFAMVNE